MKLTPVKYAALNLTHDCNLRCRYCYAGPKLHRPMDFKTAVQAVDFLASQSPDCTITFFGGEPLLEFPLMKQVIEYSRKAYGNNVNFRMSTNGTLVTPEILKYFAEQDVYFALSIDGSQAQHDASRRYANDTGSYRDISKILPNILEFNPYTIAISVIVPQTAGYLADGVISLFEKGFRYVLQTLDYSAGWKSSDINILKKQYRRLAAFYFDSLKSGNKIYYSPFDERIKTWSQNNRTFGDVCDLASSQVAIAPSGRIYPCVQFIGSDDGVWLENSIGSVAAGFDTARREHFVSWNGKDRQSCVGCPLYGRCATYCGCLNWRATGDLSVIPPIVCEHERMLMPIVDEMANELWEKNVDLFKRKFYEKSYPVSSYIEDCMRKQGG